eukprot:s63_g48.t1
MAFAEVRSNHGPACPKARQWGVNPFRHDNSKMAAECRPAAAKHQWNGIDVCAAVDWSLATESAGPGLSCWWSQICFSFHAGLELYIKHHQPAD